MPSNEHFTEYCQQVSQQIRWKRVRGVVAQELEQHLCDQQDAYVEQGHDADEAARMAVAQMGDAQMVGQALNQTHIGSRCSVPVKTILDFLQSRVHLTDSGFTLRKQLSRRLRQCCCLLLQLCDHLVRRCIF